MTIKHGKIKVDTGNDMYVFRYIYDIYEKTEGNYVEYLLNKSHYIEGSIENGEENITMDVEEDNYEIHPNATLDHVLSKLPSSNFEWIKPLTAI